jgi:magnesium-transporting ATPase (P-type)
VLGIIASTGANIFTTTEILLGVCVFVYLLNCVCVYEHTSPSLLALFTGQAYAGSGSANSGTSSASSSSSSSSSNGNHGGSLLSSLILQLLILAFANYLVFIASSLLNNNDDSSGSSNNNNDDATGSFVVDVVQALELVNVVIVFLAAAFVVQTIQLLYVSLRCVFVYILNMSDCVCVRS